LLVFLPISPINTDKPVANLLLLGDTDYALEQSTVALQCNVHANPPVEASLQWFFNGQPLRIDNKGLTRNQSAIRCFLFTFIC
jgi:hypothetical protein